MKYIYIVSLILLVLPENGFSAPPANCSKIQSLQDGKSIIINEMKFARKGQKILGADKDVTANIGQTGWQDITAKIDQECSSSSDAGDDQNPKGPWCCALGWVACCSAPGM